ncbi:Putrescine-binding periplasmic protein [Georgfuchsia toluolica]|uniref:Putrescine-binding periplasmic protein n=1 Tax=Georgfuchsia toluolica TaxID=424218 RepID=A0A916J566_9PROT|nr:spermidine/putrescine ABC transporter substrate-binding protein [Georgfuchsia toluolica]CAG4884429.1 Putrescine-binding periplasmic protein [Georgfuchsia toluolica]
MSRCAKAVCKWLVAAAFLAAFGCHAADSLHIYNWNNYIGPQTLERFRRECECNVSYDTYGSNDELLAKLAAGARGYDILVPTGNAVESLVRQQALRPIDKGELDNFRNIDPAYLNPHFDPGNIYSIPYAYTITLIGYNAERMKALGVPTDTWAAIFEPRYLMRMQGKVTVLDDQRELMAAALKYLGLSVNDPDETHWRRAAQVIMDAKPYWAAFNNTSYIRLLASGDIWLAHGYSNDMFQAAAGAREAKRGIKIGYTVPREGAVLALDSMVIPHDAPRPDLALRFIDFMLNGRNSAELTNLTGSGNPNQAALPYVQPEIAANPGIFPDRRILTRLEQLKDMDRRKRRLLSRLWTEIKLK